ncbi:sulfite oxidase heme-binding subunit YedZ [Candidatus Magnetominusculus xianensis]|uniref:sulfite oxidase heme-binding subunit YedZ n=1 Tax=Candidatus Magnetominusculus xianensis TaxID=1748249 RepID=UPI0019E009E3|nr:ferric reductase-like transmembrane domain-containing protein [Candidatus Magnetominusculus xianensis]MBF0405377.1 ferric reductase-like transmembrane domain-containing protein [Nitrospirota bacterium]
MITKIRGSATVLLFLAPCAYLVWAGLTARLGANPVEKVIHITGDWALNFLILAIASRTLLNLSYLRWIALYHKASGRAAFLYATLHVLTYAAAEHNFSVSEILVDAATHTRIIFGTLAYASITAAVVMMGPVIIKRISYERLRGLHKAAVYTAATTSAIHYVWLVKKDIRTPLIYGAVIAVLAAHRVITKITEGKRPA